MYDKPIQHGEMVLTPAKKLPKGSIDTKDSFIGSFSRAGHHHMLNSKGMSIVKTKDATYVQVHHEGTITHQKTTDAHGTLVLPVGIFKIGIKTEYDLFEDVIRDVQD